MTYMQSAGLASIVMPTYNGARYLTESLDSCLSQTYRDIELIIVDDGSTDNTPSVIERISDSRVVKIRLDSNQGLSAALNAGFKHSQGRYLTWTSDDNRYAPSAIQTMVKCLEEHPEIAFVYAGAWLIDAGGHVTGRFHPSPPEKLREENCVGWCFLYRRAVYETVGEYDPRMRLIEDYDYWLRVADCFQMAVISDPLYFYRVHETSLSGSQRHLAARLALRLRHKRFGVDRATYRQELGRTYMAEVFEAHSRGDLRAVRSSLWPALINAPHWLMNPGVRAITCHVLVGSHIMNLLRTFKHRLDRV